MMRFGLRYENEKNKGIVLTIEIMSLKSKTITLFILDNHLEFKRKIKLEKNEFITAIRLCGNASISVISDSELENGDEKILKTKPYCGENEEGDNVDALAIAYEGYTMFFEDSNLEELIKVINAIE